MVEAIQEHSPDGGLVVTPSAARRIWFLRDHEARPEAALRLRIIAGGCSGMQYRIDLADRLRPDDQAFDRDGAKVLVDPKSFAYLRNSTLDWYEDLLGGQFKISNPNAKTSCSCGVSFTV